jgi:hypothetical protein
VRSLHNLRLEAEVRVYIAIEGVSDAGEEAEEACEGDHGGVVGAEGSLGDGEFDAFGFAAGGEGFAQGAVEADAAGDSDEVEACGFGGADGFFDEDFDDGGLEGGGDVLWFGGFIFLEGVEDGGFEAGEGEIEFAGMDHGPREGEGVRISRAGDISGPPG